MNETGDVTTSSLADGCDTTDISMTESISFDTCSVNDDVHSLTSGPSSKEVSPDHRSLTLPSKLVKNAKINERDELDELLQVERNIDSSEKLYQTLPSPISTQSSPEKQSNSSSVSSSTQQVEATKNSGSDDNVSKTDTETDFKSAETTQITSTDDSSTLTNKTNNDTGEYFTPMNTLKPVDFDDFKRQIREEFIQNSSQLQHLNDNTLKSHQPIDPSRINDSLKLYSENVMSKSFSGEAGLREVPTSIYYQTLNNNKSDCSSSNSTNYELKKSGSAAVSSSSSDLSASTENGGVNRSRSGPNWYRNQFHPNDNENEDSDDDNSATLKPAANDKHRSIHIKMDCYDETQNGVSSTTSEATTTLTTPTSLFDDDLDDDINECVVVLRKPRTGSTAIKRRSGNRRFDMNMIYISWIRFELCFSPLFTLNKDL